MPSNYKCNCLLFTFRPLIEEFRENNSLENFIKYLDKIGNIYVLSYESGEVSNDISHFHLYMRLDKEMKFDKLKDQLKKKLKLDYNVEKFQNEKVCFDFLRITNEHYKKYYYGYVLKEGHKKIKFNSLTEMENECLKYYEENKQKNKKKMFLNQKNICPYVYSFVVNNGISPKNDISFQLSPDFGNILDRMLENEYSVSSLSERQLLHLGRLSISYLNYKFYETPITYFTDLIETLIEKEQNYGF